MQHAKLTYNDDGTPVSVDFNDVYFSQGQGQAESQYVFIEPSNLPRRFASLKTGQSFTIAETGFGTGLNFLMAWNNFLQHAAKGTQLNFVSCEKFPIERFALANALQNFPQLAPLAEQLLEQYPPALQGYHQLEFGCVKLLLMFDDANTAYQELTASVDAWFLDGFAPSRNPEMWQPRLFREMHRLSHPKTTVATFTTARLVRDGLTGAGFKLTKSPGFGLKREMCSGVFAGITGPVKPAPWPSSLLPIPKPTHGKRIAIIGAGIAGITTAVELRKLGYQVKVLERHSEPASGGSGNVQGAVYAKLSADGNDSTRFYAQALILAQRILASLPSEVAHDSCGLVQLVHNEREQLRLEAIVNSGFIPEELAQIRTADQLSTKLGIEVTDPGVWFPEGGWLAPRQLIKYLIKAHQLDCSYDQNITALEYTGSQWLLINQDGESFIADQVVLCNASEARSFSQTKHLPLKPVAGQVTQLAAEDSIQTLKAVICTDRYVMPVLDQQLTIGSTFRIKNPHTEVTEADHDENIASLKQRLPNLITHEARAINGRAGVRCTAPDYLPLVGPIADEAYIRSHYSLAIQRNQSHKLPAIAQLPGLWLNVAHGSKGLCSSHLCARTLAAMINGDPLPLQASIVNKLNPNRFTIRNILRARREKQ